MVERLRRYWADTIGHTQQISSGQTFTDILNLRCDLDLEHSNSIFQQDILAYGAVLWNQAWLQADQQFRRYNGNITWWLYKPSLLLRHWTQWTNFCMTLWLIMLHKNARFGDKVFCVDIGQTFTNILNLCCDLKLGCSNLIFPQDTPAYDAVLWNEVWMQMDQQFRRYSKNSQIWLYKPTRPWHWR